MLLPGLSFIKIEETKEFLLGKLIEKTLTSQVFCGPRPRRNDDKGEKIENSVNTEMRQVWHDLFL